MHFVRFDGVAPPPGVPANGGGRVSHSLILLPKLQNRPISAEIHTDAVTRVTGRTWPAKKKHVVQLDLAQ